MIPINEISHTFMNFTKSCKLKINIAEWNLGIVAYFPNENHELVWAKQRKEKGKLRWNLLHSVIVIWNIIKKWSPELNSVTQMCRRTLQKKCISRDWCNVNVACDVNSSPPSAAYMRQWIGSALVQIMACHLFGAKPLSKPMLDYCQLDH